MKTKGILFISVLLVILILACTKEPPSLSGFSATVENTDVDAGSQVIFTINQGDAEFITFYSGRPGSVYENYPVDKGQQLDLQNSNTFSASYNDQGQFLASIVAISYGNWAEDSKETVLNFTINVTDNRTGITSFLVKLSLTTQIRGVINEESHTITVTFPAGSSLSQRSTLFVAQSPGAKVFLADNSEILSGVKLDYTAGFTLKVVAPGGAEQLWTVVPVVNP
jgi:hypothetical protein